ncbi:MAG: AtpZ/AtpI family protein [Dehalococcoidia bacterium]
MIYLAGEYCRGLVVNRWAAALRLSGIGFWIGGCIFLGIVLGVWLDGKVGISPLFTLVGLGFGLFAAFFGTYRLLLSTLGRGKGKGDS